MAIFVLQTICIELRCPPWLGKAVQVSPASAPELHYFSLEKLKLRGLTDGEVVNVHYPNPETLHCSDGGFSYHRDYR